MQHTDLVFFFYIFFSFSIIYIYYGRGGWFYFILFFVTDNVVAVFSTCQLCKSAIRFCQSKGQLARDGSIKTKITIVQSFPFPSILFPSITTLHTERERERVIVFIFLVTRCLPFFCKTSRAPVTSRFRIPSVYVCSTCIVACGTAGIFFLVAS